MERRNFLSVAFAMGAISGCIGQDEEPEAEGGPESEDPEEEPAEETTGEPESTEEPTEESDPAEFEITDLVVEPTEVSPGESVSVTATIENTGGTEGTERVEFTVGEDTLTEDVSVAPGETTDVSISVSRDTTGTFEVSIADRSVSFDVVREWNEIGESYEGAGGLTVTLESLEITEKTGSYEYTIAYTLENEADGGIDEGQFQLYPTDSDNDPLQQYGAFDELFPGDTVERTYTFEEEKDVEFDALAYHPDQFFEQSPPSDALVWPVEY